MSAEAARIVEAGVLAPGDAPPQGLRAMTPDELGSTWNIALRKKASPFVVSFETASTGELERLTFGASYKGATDFVTKYLWPWPARQVTRWCDQHGRAHV